MFLSEDMKVTWKNSEIILVLLYYILEHIYCDNVKIKRIFLVLVCNWTLIDPVFQTFNFLFPNIAIA